MLANLHTYLTLASTTTWATRVCWRGRGEPPKSEEQRRERGGRNGRQMQGCQTRLIPLRLSSMPFCGGPGQMNRAHLDKIIQSSELDNHVLLWTKDICRHRRSVLLFDLSFFDETAVQVPPTIDTARCTCIPSANDPPRTACPPSDRVLARRATVLIQVFPPRTASTRVMSRYAHPHVCLCHESSCCSGGFMLRAPRDQGLLWEGCAGRASQEDRGEGYRSRCSSCDNRSGGCPAKRYDYLVAMSLIHDHNLFLIGAAAYRFE
jgi:hypothetical protein